MKVSEARDYYHGLLERHLDSTVELLHRGSLENGLYFGSRSVCTVLRPYFIDRETYAFVKRASELVMRAVARLGELLLTEAELRRELDLEPQEEAVALIPSGFGNPDVSARLDGFLAPEGEFYFVEYNAESPGGLAYGDVLAEIFMQMPVMKEFCDRYKCSIFPVRERVYENLIAAYHRWGGHDLPNIAIVDWSGVSTYSEFVLMKKRFEERGCKVVICDPDELEYRNGRLYREDFCIDLVYKRVIIGELLTRKGIDHPIFQAARDRAVCVSNGMGVQMLYKKAMFALLSDPVFSAQLGLDDELAAACNKYIPWTRKLRSCKTKYGDKEVDLVEFTFENKERLVLKPNGEYGGKGVVLGWEASDELWKDTVKEALDGASYLVQERVPLGRDIYPSYIDGKLVFDERYVDIDPYVWNGTQIEGAGIRLSKLALLNVSAGGGSATPLVVLE
ncbi:MAG: hypothetical protein RMM17_01700 [Acidobacteriota bacterium]|nr:hypothetical protein [Blastocatellia bacterium]MDW8411384.1 hypothetical protein [Acidobacteriota bacterium]